MKPQTKAPWIGGPAGPADSQENNQSVLDTPKSGPSTPTKPIYSSGTNFDPTDHSSDNSVYAKRHAQRQKDFPGDFQPGNAPDKAE